MFQLIVRLLVNGVALWVAAEIVPGMTLDTANPSGVFLVVLVFAIVNALLKPVAKVLGFPFIILTLGLFTLVINAGLLALTAWLAGPLSIDGFFPALFGAVIVSVVSWFLGLFVSDDDEEED